MKKSPPRTPTKPMYDAGLLCALTVEGDGVKEIWQAMYDAHFKKGEFYNKPSILKVLT